MRPRPQGKIVKTLIVRNLPRGCEDLEALLRTTFEPYGAVRDVYIPKNMDASSPYFGTIKGFALVKFAELASAYSASAVSLGLAATILPLSLPRRIDNRQPS
jgi:RNA recognition motif-containing protein